MCDQSQSVPFMLGIVSARFAQIIQGESIIRLMFSVAYNKFVTSRMAWIDDMQKHPQYLGLNMFLN